MAITGELNCDLIAQLCEVRPRRLACPFPCHRERRPLSALQYVALHAFFLAGNLAGFSDALKVWNCRTWSCGAIAFFTRTLVKLTLSRRIEKAGVSKETPASLREERP